MEQEDSPTVADAFNHWLKASAIIVRPVTLQGYMAYDKYIVGPLLEGTSAARRRYRLTGERSRRPLLPMLGATKISELTTAQIRAWYSTLATHVSLSTAHRSKKLLQAALSLFEEDFRIRTPKMPQRMGVSPRRSKKDVLTLNEGRSLLTFLRSDSRRCLYVSFPFLTGVRPGEQLGLQWRDLDLLRGEMHIRRSQGVDGLTVELTKNSASLRTVPLCNAVCEMLRRHRAYLGHPPPDQSVFTCFGGRAHRPGRVLRYYNYRKTFWQPALRAYGLPGVTPHSARHWFCSYLQYRGIEVTVVAQLLGHSNPNVTLSVYSHSFRNNQTAVRAIDELFEDERKG